MDVVKAGVLLDNHHSQTQYLPSFTDIVHRHFHRREGAMGKVAESRRKARERDRRWRDKQRAEGRKRVVVPLPAWAEEATRGKKKIGVVVAEDSSFSPGACFIVLKANGSWEVVREWGGRMLTTVEIIEQ